jgi:hypothetical protein
MNYFDLIYLLILSPFLFDAEEWRKLRTSASTVLPVLAEDVSAQFSKEI